MKLTIQRKGFALFALGIGLMLALLLLTGAGTQEPPVGRYRMAVTVRNNFTDIYVIDTVTGVVKYLGNDEGKPFDQIRGK